MLQSERDPRTKADAIREPRFGDRWRDDTWASLKVTDFCRPGESPSWPCGVVTLFGQHYSQDFNFDGGWQRWAENAEFLGGADE